MMVFDTGDELREAVIKEKVDGKSIGFSPTMGALHAGHLSLINKSMTINDISVCSIFVNPAQFNVKEDLDKYPKTLTKDLELLQEIGCHYVFTPSVNEIYPFGIEKAKIDLQGLDVRMEGSERPGHFEGVVQVVKRLLDIVQPDHLYMGQKDFQQFTIVKFMINHFQMNCELVVCPIEREIDGLAMSSRNSRLKPRIRSRASVIYRTLKAFPDWLKYIPVKYSIEKAMDALSIPDFNPEYFELIDGNTLYPIEDYFNSEYIVACTAVWAGDVRLIDNMIYKHELW